MANILIAYASMSGNTEEIADHIMSVLEDSGHSITLEEMDELNPQDLLDYDAVLLGSYTWGDGDLPYEVEEFYEEMEEVDLNGLPAASFGSGDTSYPKFCEAVNLFQSRLEASGAFICQEGFKIEMALNVKEDYERCTSFTRLFEGKMTEKLQLAT
ncbi:MULTISPECIES: flavodoxin [Pontibacillus]|uniref:Flavodoxin n=1 Tax=Pontibacillus chungwhensis TaxID=265426 RepID=A0ABY8UV92_9BACI|nr:MULTISPECIES: flavodoxin [Pontibacillus]MCD5323293.1 flavodoxin [Pontibacillus sp. HN14]WIF96676.1 flavodoxin [Pontibacillus chungwhensis]